MKFTIRGQENVTVTMYPTEEEKVAKNPVKAVMKRLNKDCEGVGLIPVEGA